MVAPPGVFVLIAPVALLAAVEAREGGREHGPGAEVAKEAGLFRIEIKDAVAVDRELPVAVDLRLQRGLVVGKGSGHAGMGLREDRIYGIGGDRLVATEVGEKPHQVVLLGRRKGVEQPLRHQAAHGFDRVDLFKRNLHDRIAHRLANADAAGGVDFAVAANHAAVAGEGRDCGIGRFDVPLRMEQGIGEAVGRPLQAHAIQWRPDAAAVLAHAMAGKAGERVACEDRGTTLRIAMLAGGCG